MRAIGQAQDQVGINATADEDHLTSLATEGMMGMGDSHIFQRRLAYRGGVQRVFRQCKIEPCKPYICMLWTPLPKHWPTQTRMGFGRNGVVRTQWSKARRCSRIALDHNGYWKETSNPALTKSAIRGC